MGEGAFLSRLVYLWRNVSVSFSGQVPPKAQGSCSEQPCPRWWHNEQ